MHGLYISGQYTSQTLCFIDTFTQYKMFRVEMMSLLTKEYVPIGRGFILLRIEALTLVVIQSSWPSRQESICLIITLNVQQQRIATTGFK